MKKLVLYILPTLFTLFFVSSLASAHCELPCGIYDDSMRIDMLSEHITTMEKAMNKVQELKKQEPFNYNQLVRWIVNKEDHAQQFQDIVSQYFLTQRIHPDEENYDKKLQILHQMLYYAMRCKQTTDLSHIEELRSLLKEFEKLYFK